MFNKKLLSRSTLTALLCTAALATGSASVSAETIKLGFLGPLSGGSAYEGEGARNGFLLAIKQANESGDYPYTVEPVVLDDASDPTAGASAALKFVNERNAVAATGHWNSPVALATIPIFNRNKMPFIVWGAISPKITEANYPEVTRVVPTSEMENQPLADWAVKDMGWKRFSIISDTSDYGTSNTQAFTNYIVENGGEIISTDSFPVGTTDFRSALSKIKSEKPDAVYFGGVVTEAALVRSQMYDQDMSDLPMLGISGIFDEKLVEITKDKGDGIIASVQKVKENPNLAAFEEDYKAEDYSTPAGTYAKYSYDATNILLETIKNVGYKDKEKLAQAIRDIEYDGAVGLTSFDENGQTQLIIDATRYIVKDGQWQEIE